MMLRKKATSLCLGSVVVVTLGAGLNSAWPAQQNGSSQLPSAAGKQSFDGPAELPRVTVDVSLPQQTGKVINVREGDDLQEALNNAKCGDTIRLQAGASFVGSYVLPAKPCDDAHWIVIRTSSPDSVLPPPGTRLAPCYSGVESLPGRPPLNCTSTKVVTAQVVGRTNEGPITFAAGANHYRFIGLELTRVPPPKPLLVYKIAGPDNADSPSDHLIFDRVWAHGTAQDEMAHGIRLNGVTYAAVVDSTFTDFHCIARSGACTDSQAISGGNGSLPAGPFLIENNFLEAAGENIMFGGGPGTGSPTDITIRRNHLFKPLTWHSGESGFVGGLDGQPFIVKNLFELKKAVRVLFEDNILEYSWGGFTQVGFAIVLTPRNQAETPSTQITDVTIRRCLVRHTGAGIQISNPPGAKGNAPSTAGERYSIHDLLFDDIDVQRFNGRGNLVQVSMGHEPGTPPLRHVKIDHVTAFPPRVLLNVGGTSPPEMLDFTFTNNLVSAGGMGVTPTGSPCTPRGRRDAVAILDSCFKNYVFKNNVIIDEAGFSWPSGNFIIKNAKDAAIATVDTDKGKTYRLAANSRYRGKAADGKDVGADVEAITTGIAGVF